jgi:signal-transduction protein with cAMP-binding, CBS, and nucleotidyltransferase domain
VEEESEGIDQERAVEGDKLAAMPVKNIMVRQVYSVTPEDNAKHVMSLMTRHRVRHLLVRKDGKLSGIISIGDVVKQRLEDLELEANVLRDAYMARR